MKKDNQAVIKALNMYGRVPEMWELLEEIERLNNIINIANKKLKNISKSSSAYNYQCKIEEVINILQELKGSDKYE